MSELNPGVAPLETQPATTDSVKAENQRLRAALQKILDYEPFSEKITPEQYAKWIDKIADEALKFVPVGTATPVETPSDINEIVISLARELYDRFVMGGWQPQDAHPMIHELLFELESQLTQVREELRQANLRQGGKQ